MNHSEITIDNWLVATDQAIDNAADEIWEPGFSVDRQVVYRKLGPYKKLFLRPEKFVKRFYHTVYPLPIEEWQCTDQVQLYDGFCTMSLTLDLRFQATFKYALSNMEIISELNEHIKNAYHGLVIDIVHRELLNLSDGAWVQEGLDKVEKRICLSVNEMLIVQNIQSFTVCKLKPVFEEFPDVQFAKENVYLCVLKKSFEFREQQKEELFRQQQAVDTQKIDHKRQKLKQIIELAEIDRKRQAIQAENTECFLEEKEQQQLKQFEIQKRVHADKIRHNNKLKEMTLLAELKEKEKYQVQLRNNEEQEKINLIAQQAKLKERELGADVANYEKEQAQWRETKNKIHSEELDIKHRQKQLEFDTDVGYKKRYELQRLAMQEESYAARKKSDVYLKREIELLELEKQRLVLQLSIKDVKERDKKNRDVDEIFSTEK